MNGIYIYINFYFKIGIQKKNLNERNSKKAIHFIVFTSSLLPGLPVYPYYSYAQTKVARALAKAARRQPPNFVLNVGDNFYFNGVSDIFDTRFEASFEEIYDYPELLVPWYTIAGNHDHLGNISAQLAHTNFSNKWFDKK